jgi:hypothetical protein
MPRHTITVHDPRRPGQVLVQSDGPSGDESAELVAVYRALPSAPATIVVEGAHREDAATGSRRVEGRIALSRTSSHSVARRALMATHLLHPLSWRQRETARRIASSRYPGSGGKTTSTVSQCPVRVSRTRTRQRWSACRWTRSAMGATLAVGPGGLLAPAVFLADLVDPGIAPATLTSHHARWDALSEQVARQRAPRVFRLLIHAPPGNSHCSLLRLVGPAMVLSACLLFHSGTWRPP